MSVNDEESHEVLGDFERHDATLSMVAANLVAIPLMIVIALAFILAYQLLWGWSGTVLSIGGPLNLVLAFAVFILGIVVHEGLHAIGWVLAGPLSWSEIDFGIKDLTPYTHAKMPMPVRPYRVGTALPGLLLGLLPGILGLILGSPRLTVWGIVFAGTAAGDALVLWLIRTAPPEALIRDHPSKVGCEVLVPKD